MGAHAAQVRACPSDDGRLDLDDDDRVHVRAREGLVERVAHPEAAQEDAGVLDPFDRLANEGALRPLVAGVHQEHAVEDDLEVIAEGAQRQLARIGVQAFDDDRARLLDARGG
jgi:hypothetical protein